MGTLTLTFDLVTSMSTGSSAVHDQPAYQSLRFERASIIR